MSWSSLSSLRSRARVGRVPVVIFGQDECVCRHSLSQVLAELNASLSIVQYSSFSPGTVHTYIQQLMDLHMPATILDCFLPTDWQTDCQLCGLS